MFEVRVKHTGSTIKIRWQFFKVDIPAEDILDIYQDETYGGGPADAVRIGFPSATTDRIVMKTTKETYILFTTSPATILATLRK
ncbi:hypothetical protein QRD89_07620 [Halobacillus sp. ACCC02827]|uniref:SunI/YnzG family protein n=1 Tax=unclassified Halobacillus TaxID=2636472 RepID=UPI000782F514|nr:MULTISPECIES: hypothetical protein [unclassified Halobacillus]WJE17206.1 hypothetical protein QRD89_07620 [Halobacillus sp. ACCC02827]